MSGAEQIVVIGAGAAGIAAARTLHDAGRTVLVLEASGRLGGRAHTLTLDGCTLDLGCSWLHSAGRNPWTALAEQAGVVIDRAPARWDRQWRDLGYPAAEQAAFAAARDRWEKRVKAAAAGPDRPLADFVAPDERWRPRLEAISGYVNGAQLRDVSLHDWNAYDEAATNENWRLPAGYGTLVASLAHGLDVRLGTPGLRIDHRGRTLRIETPRGTIEAAAAIVAIPTPHLAAGELTFDPPLPAKAEAAAALPLGLADKVFLRIAGDDYPHNVHLTGKPDSAFTANYHIGAFGWPVIEAFLGGDCAEMLERAGDGAAAAFAVDELVNLLGSGWRARLTPLVTTRWRQDPFARGSYSYARIGQAAMRSVLAEPVDDRILFAGEACSPLDFSTAHGAYATGVAAAHALIG